MTRNTFCDPQEDGPQLAKLTQRLGHGLTQIADGVSDVRVSEPRHNLGTKLPRFHFRLHRGQKRDRIR